MKTKRALLMSAISLFLCFSMLIGTTFAWFTDSVTSANNTIKSGNLDIKLEFWNGEEWADVKGASDILTNTLWEPGVTEIAYLRVANAGSLALKYQLGINIVSEKEGVNAEGETFKLSDYIQFGIVENVNGKTDAYENREAAVAAVEAIAADQLGAVKKISAGYTKATSMASGEELYLALVVWMPTTVSNVANYKTSDDVDDPDKYRPTINLGINIVATQVTAEEDSFDKEYDTNATFPTVDTKQEGNSVTLMDSGKQVTLQVPENAPAGEYELKVGPKTYSSDEYGNTTMSMEINLLRDGKKDSTIACPIEVNLGTGLTGLRIIHDGEEITNFEYNPTSGLAKFTTTFSPFEFIYADGGYVAATETAGYNSLAEAITNAKDGDVITLLKDIAEDVTVVQQPNVKITIDGNDKTLAGMILVDGKSSTYTTAGLAIKNLTFKSNSISADACIRLGDGNTATRYTCNVTIENCTFDVPGAVGVKSYTGGDKNVTITGCTATANAHSLCQLKGVDGVLVEKCIVNSKNGMNFNNSDHVVVDSCVTDVKGYAVRFGETSGGTGIAESYTITNSTLKSACEDGDSVIILRGTADNATLNLNNTTLEGTSKIANSATNAKVLLDGNAYVSDGLAKNGANYYVSNANGLETLNTMIADGTIKKGYAIILTADIDFTGKTWTPVDSHVDFKNYVTEINGNGYTLYNLTINGQAMFTRFAGSGDVTIKDITFYKANVTSTALNTSILTVQTYQNVLLDNVDVTYSTITGTYKVATLIGTVYNENDSTITATLKNCDVSNTTVSGTLDFMITGMVAFVNESNNDRIVFENCTLSNVTLKCNSTSYNAMANVYCNDGSAKGSFDTVDGVTVTNVTKE